tara:strand:+ start:53 stop:598 length:546 start_codon:yes stop_codon:yes gene_type:complete
MNTKNIENYLKSFGQNVVDDSKKLLYSEKGNTALGKSIRFKVVPTATGFSTKFYMDDYGTFLDKGVSGNKEKQSFQDWKGRGMSSPYSYTTKGPPIDILSKWIKRKGIKPKGLGRGRSKKTGQFISGFAYLISKKIKREGIKSLSFFQKPLGLWYDRLQDDFLKIFTQDIQSYLTTFTKHK